ncbi:MAG: hypothetical protein ABI336_03085 [Humibacillus sp.]
MAEHTKAQWPGKAVDAGGDDLTTGLRRLLEDSRLLETVLDEAAGVGLLSGTPQSLQVMTAGSTALTKGWTVVTAGLGGGSAIFAAIATFWKDFGTGIEEALQRSVLMLSAALLAAAVVWAVAAMVRADVQGRATAQAALYAARGVYAGAFLSTVQAALPTPPPPLPTPPPTPPPAPQPAPPPTPPSRSYLVRKDGDWILVLSFGWADGQPLALTASDKIPADEWTGLIELPSA